MRRVCTLYALSGFASLGYQVVWFRVFAGAFGSSSFTFLLVLSNFIAGLGLGAIASRALTARIESSLRLAGGLRTYGVVELAVSAAVLLTFAATAIPAELWGAFPYELRDGIYRPKIAYLLGQGLLAALCVLVPSFFMGLTYPLLCRVFPARELFPSALYASNTVGACTGVLVTQVLLIPQVGHPATLWALIALNGLIGTAALLMRPPAEAHVPARERNESVERSERVRPATLITLAALSGFVVGGLEGDLFKRLWFVGATSGAAMAFLSFWAVLAVFLASWTVAARLIRSLGPIKVAYTLAAALYVVLWQHAYELRGWFEDQAAQSLGSREDATLVTSDVVPISVQTDFGFTFWYVGLLVFPVVYLTSTLLPLVCNLAHRTQGRVGFVYGANTLAFCLGMVCFTWAAPRASAFYAFKLMLVVLAVAVALLWSLRAQSRRPIVHALAALSLLAAGAVTVPAGFDRAYLDPGRRAYHHPVRAMKSNGAHTTFVVALPAGDALYFDGHPMSGTSRGSRTYMRLMAHFPLLAQAAPERALVIGFGVGNTAAAIALHESISRLDVVDLNHKVFETAPEFAATNGGVARDRRTRLIHDDGRSFLARTESSYDLITSEPPPPMQDGVYRLYSTEYYRDALARLSEHGMLTQWVPVSQLPGDAVRLIVGTFVQGFPSSLLIAGYSGQWVLVGSRHPVPLRRLEEQLARRVPVARDLAALGLHGPVALLGRILALPESLERAYGHTPLISDERNDLAYQFSNLRELPALRFEPDVIAKQIRASGLEHATELEALYSHLGRLAYRVPDFPLEWLRIAPERAGAVALGEVSWRRVAALREGYVAARRAGRSDEARALLEQMLAEAPEQPAVLLELARMQMNEERYGEAARTMRRFLALEPADPAGYLGLGVALLRGGEPVQAAAAAREGLRLDPTAVKLLVLEGRARAANGELGPGLERIERALALDPDDLDAVQAHTELLARLKQGTHLFSSDPGGSSEGAAGK